MLDALLVTKLTAPKHITSTTMDVQLWVQDKGADPIKYL